MPKTGVGHTRGGVVGDGRRGMGLTEARVIKWTEEALEGSETFEWMQKFRKFEKQTQSATFPGRNCNLPSASAQPSLRLGTSRPSPMRTRSVPTLITTRCCEQRTHVGAVADSDSPRVLSASSDTSTTQHTRPRAGLDQLHHWTAVQQLTTSSHLAPISRTRSRYKHLGFSDMSEHRWERPYSVCFSP